MAFFANLRPLVRIAVALEEISRALCYFAVADARANRRMFSPRKPPLFNLDDRSELMNSDPATVFQARLEEQAFIEQHGYAGLEEAERLAEDSDPLN